jgi:shikimate dehydrogenase
LREHYPKVVVKTGSNDPAGFDLIVNAKGCRIQVGTDMLFEQIPAYLELFGFGTATPDELRAVSQIPK